MSKGGNQQRGNLFSLRCPFLILSLSASLLMSSLSAAQQVKVLESDDTGILLSFQPGPLTKQTVDTDSGEADILRLADCGITDKVGYPMLPEKSVLVGIPPEAEVNLQIVSTRSVVQSGYSVAPLPKLVGERRNGELFYEKHFIKDPQVYCHYLFYPRQVVSLGRPGFLRDQRIVEVTFWPIRYNPLRHEIERYEQIVVRLLFSHPAGQRGFLEHSLNEEIEEFYRRVLVNYQSARRWRRASVQKRLLAAGVSFPPGEYLKINVKTDGIYCLRWSDLKKAGIDPDQIDPNTIKMYYGGGRELPRDPSVPPPQWRQIPIVVDTASGYILFYGNSVSGWDYDKQNRDFTHFINHYTRQNCYWLSLGGTEPGKRMTCRDGTPWRKGAFFPQGFRARIHQETERYSTWADPTGGSGIEWYWDRLSKTSGEKKYPFLTFHPNTTDTCLIKIRLLEESGRDHLLQISLNGEIINSARLIDFNDTTIVILKTTNLLKTGSNYLGIKELIENSKVRLDWFEVEYTERFAVEQGELFFTAPLCSQVAEFRISGINSRDTVWIFEVSDPFEVTQITGGVCADGRLTFQDSLRSDTPRQYYVVSESRWKAPESITVYDNALDLREEINGLDHIIITHPQFLEPAQRLAKWRTQRGLNSMAVSVDDIYNQFSWGLFDPTAIRNFLRHLVENGNPNLRYVLLFGDGCYDYKNNSGISPGNWIPPYEQGAITTDDWFACFDHDSSLPSMAVGRFPAQSAEDAEVMVDKVIDYERRSSRGVWQNTVILVADDDHVRGRYDGIIDYTVDTENIALHCLPQSLDQVKLYLTEYPLDSFGKKPKARKEFIEAFNQGALLINFVGHANYTTLTHEGLFEAATDISLLNNGQRLPLFFGSTCSVNHFDHPVNETICEKLLRRANGGLIAAIGPTRMAYNEPNVRLNSAFYKQLFSPSEQPPRVGKALWMAKVLVGGGSNAAKFSLLGDPALCLVTPQMKVSLSVSPDTLKALGEINISGVLPDRNFDGQCYVRVFDSSRYATYKSPRGPTVGYSLPGAPLFRGILSIEDGRFEHKVRIPKDISYGSQRGRVSVFVWNEQIDGCGKVDSLFVGGTARISREDTEGPDITIDIKGQHFADGDYVGPSPIIQATIEDESGINITGEIGHEITLTVDARRIYNVTKYLLCENSYKKGIVRYQLENLSEGEHTLALKAWDIFNNSATKSVTLVVVPEEKFSIRDALCYPNPMSSEMVFTYELPQPAQQVKVKVFSISGRLIDEFEGETNRGYNQAPLEQPSWIPPIPLANGVYLYKIVARSSNGKKAELIEKFSVIR